MIKTNSSLRPVDVAACNDVFVGPLSGSGRHASALKRLSLTQVTTLRFCDSTTSSL